MKLKIKGRERDCILAALRYWQWQRTGHHCDGERFEQILDIEHNEHNRPLSDADIDHLCERINFGED